MRGKCFMVDCGEGTQISLRRSRLRFTKLQAVFISHLHGDHCFGLIGMVSTFGMLGRVAPLDIYAPAALEPLLRTQLDMFCPGLGYEVVFHAVDTTASRIIFEDKSMTVTSIPLDHRVPCCGFLFREKPGRRHVIRDMIDCYEIPISQIDNIKNGFDWTTPDGEVVPNAQLTTAPDRTRAYAYCSDTRYMPKLHEAVEGVDLLYHESTYTEACADRARLYYHSTARQAATVARAAHVGKLLLGHYSARYEDEQGLLREAREVFPESYLSTEGLTVSVK